MRTLRDFLERIGLAQYVSAFEANDVDLDVLSMLSDADLAELGVSLGNRRKILRGVEQFRNAHEVQAPAVATIPSSTSAAERRQLTILFCDLVGSTSLAQRLDAEVLRDLMQRYQRVCGEVIAKYEGHVAQYLGDGLMVYFGFPRAHEDDAARAVHSALEIVSAVSALDGAGAALQVRIGVATGAVVVGETGAGDASIPKLAVGETPNLASRLQGLAGPNEIVIAPSTLRLLGGTFEVLALGPQVLKGIVEPVVAHRVLGVSALATRFEAATFSGLTPLVGRDLEIGLLLDRWARSREGEGQVVLLSGEPGIGKSRILRAFSERLGEALGHTLRFQCSPYHGNSAYYPSIDHWLRTLQFARDESAASKLDKLEEVIVRRYARPRTEVRYIATLLSIECESRYGPHTMTPQRFKEETLRALVELFEAAARMQPCVLLFEDAHWADPTTLEELDLLIERVAHVPLLVLITHRPEFQPKWSAHGHVTALNLSKLTRGQTQALVLRVTNNKPLPAELTEQIVAKTDGVPLFAEELTKAVVESGHLQEEATRFVYVDPNVPVPLPATLRDSLMARLDRIAAVKDVAQMGAAIGREFAYDLLAAVSSMATHELDRALIQLSDSGLAFRRGQTPEAVFTFKHALVQDAAYDSLLKSKRQELHGKIATAIQTLRPTTQETEPETLAHHYTHAHQPDVAIPLWQKAGELALQRTALAEAISHLKRGLETVLTTPPSATRDRAEIGMRVTLGAASMAFYGWTSETVWTNFHRALELARPLNEPMLLYPILSGLWVYVLCSGRIQDSMQWAKQALDTGEQYRDPNLQMVGCIGLMVSNHWLGNSTAAMTFSNRALDLCDQIDALQFAQLTSFDPRTKIGEFVSQSLWILGYPDEAVSVSDEKDERARTFGSPFNLCYSLSFGQLVFLFRGELDRVYKALEESERVAQESSLLFIRQDQIPWIRSYPMLTQPEYREQAIATLRALYPKVNGVQQLDARHQIAAALWEMNRPQEALTEIELALEQTERPGWQQRNNYTEQLRIKGCILAHLGQLEAAEQCMLDSLAFARQQAAKSWELRTATSLARLWFSQGKRFRALDLLAPIYDWFTEGFDTRDLRDAKALIDELRA